MESFIEASLAMVIQAWANVPVGCTRMLAAALLPRQVHEPPVGQSQAINIVTEGHYNMNIFIIK